MDGLEGLISGYQPIVMETDEEGNTALHFAVICRHLLAAEVLVKSGVNMEHENSVRLLSSVVCDSASGC